MRNKGEKRRSNHPSNPAGVGKGRGVGRRKGRGFHATFCAGGGREKKRASSNFRHSDCNEGRVEKGKGRKEDAQHLPLGEKGRKVPFFSFYRSGGKKKGDEIPTLGREKKKTCSPEGSLFSGKGLTGKKEKGGRSETARGEKKDAVLE